MRRLSIIIVSMLLSAATAWSAEREENSDLHVKGRVGYSIGGTAPIGMPATIRKLNKYELKPNLSVGVDVQKNFWGKWGLQGGLRFENKSKSIDTTVKSYYMDLERGGQSIDGRFTGRVITDVRQWMFTVPVNATFQPSERVLLYAGPYLSVLTKVKTMSPQGSWPLFFRSSNRSLIRSNVMSNPSTILHVHGFPSFPFMGNVNTATVSIRSIR